MNKIMNYLKAIIILVSILFCIYSIGNYMQSSLNTMHIRANNMQMNYLTAEIVDKTVQTENKSIVSSGILNSGPQDSYMITSKHPDDTKHTFDIQDQSVFNNLAIGDTIYLVYNSSGKLTAVKQTKDDLNQYIKTILTYYDDEPKLKPTIQEIKNLQQIQN